MEIDRPNRRGRFSAGGTLPPEDAAQLAASALNAAGAEKLTTLILDFQKMTLTRSMTVTECHDVGKRLAQAGTGLRKVAVLAATEACLQAHAFVFTVATNRGLRARAFSDATQAEGWLKAA